MDSVMASVKASIKYNMSLQEKSDEKLWRSFSVSDFLFKDMVDTTLWEYYKNLGNDSMKIGDYTQAASHYHTSWNIAVGPIYGDNFNTFKKVMTLWPSGTAQFQLAEMNDVLENIATHLVIRSTFRPVFFQAPDKELFVWPPNKAAGIALGNKSAALLAAGDAEGALESASAATSFDPSYVKGHFREMKALLALHRKKEAEKKRLQMMGYEDGCRRYPAEHIALLSVSWISLDQFFVVYAPIVRKQMLDSVVKALPLDAFGNGDRGTTLQAMLVPFAGGQSLLLRLLYFPLGQQSRTVSCLGFFPVDPANCAALELPTHGRASLRAASEVPLGIGMAVNWAHDAGLRVANIVGCQGLAYPQACRAIADYLAAYGWLVPVAPARSTHVGDAFAQTLAEMARSAPPHDLAAAAAAGQWDPTSVWGRPPPAVPLAVPPVRPAAPGPALGVRLRPRRRGRVCRRLGLLP
jgi:tetratricopeptide (TPR) repeat protein